MNAMEMGSKNITSVLSRFMSATEMGSKKQYLRVEQVDECHGDGE